MSSSHVDEENDVRESVPCVTDSMSESWSSQSQSIENEEDIYKPELPDVELNSIKHIDKPIPQDWKTELKYIGQLEVGNNQTCLVHFSEEEEVLRPQAEVEMDLLEDDTLVANHCFEASGSDLNSSLGAKDSVENALHDREHNQGDSVALADLFQLSPRGLDGASPETVYGDTAEEGNVPNLVNNDSWCPDVGKMTLEHYELSHGSESVDDEVPGDEIAHKPWGKTLPCPCEDATSGAALLEVVTPGDDDGGASELENVPCGESIVGVNISTKDLGDKPPQQYLQDLVDGGHSGVEGLQECLKDIRQRVHQLETDMTTRGLTPSFVNPSTIEGSVVPIANGEMTHLTAPADKRVFCGLPELHLNIPQERLERLDSHRFLESIVKADHEAQEELRQSIKTEKKKLSQLEAILSKWPSDISKKEATTSVADSTSPACEEYGASEREFCREDGRLLLTESCARAPSKSDEVHSLRELYVGTSVEETGWKCEKCMAKNNDEASTCQFCEASRSSVHVKVDQKFRDALGTTEAAPTPTSVSSTSASKLNTDHVTYSATGNVEGASLDVWTCDICLDMFPENETLCKNCHAPRLNPQTHWRCEHCLKDWPLEKSEGAITENGAQNLICLSCGISSEVSAPLEAVESPPTRVRRPEAVVKGSEWECVNCLVKNHNDIMICECCAASRHGANEHRPNLLDALGLESLMTSSFPLVFGQPVSAEVSPELNTVQAASGSKASGRHSPDYVDSNTDDILLERCSPTESSDSSRSNSDEPGCGGDVWTCDVCLDTHSEEETYCKCCGVSRLDPSTHWRCDGCLEKWPLDGCQESSSENATRNLTCGNCRAVCEVGVPLEPPQAKPLHKETTMQRLELERTEAILTQPTARGRSSGRHHAESSLVADNSVGRPESHSASDSDAHTSSSSASFRSKSHSTEEDGSSIVSDSGFAMEKPCSELKELENASSSNHSATGVSFSVSTENLGGKTPQKYVQDLLENGNALDVLRRRMEEEQRRVEELKSEVALLRCRVSTGEEESKRLSSSLQGANYTISHLEAELGRRTEQCETTELQLEKQCREIDHFKQTCADLARLVNNLLAISNNFTAILRSSKTHSNRATIESFHELHTVIVTSIKEVERKVALAVADGDRIQDAQGNLHQVVAAACSEFQEHSKQVAGMLRVQHEKKVLEDKIVLLNQTVLSSQQQNRDLEARIRMAEAECERLRESCSSLYNGEAFQDLNLLARLEYEANRSRELQDLADRLLTEKDAQGHVLMKSEREPEPACDVTMVQRFWNYMESLGTFVGLLLVVDVLFLAARFSRVLTRCLFP